MLIIGIETSCDETAIALVRDGRQVLSSKIASQTAVHAKWGGVVPEIAAREHLVALHEMFNSAVDEAEIMLSEIDAVAVTEGPGLIGCLLVGASFAKGLAQSLNRPLIPVNHVHAHVHGALLGVKGDLGQLFPTISLVVSGGHTNLYYLKSPVDFELLAHTMDDACGESFDKVGKMLGLPYPGGPHVEQLAKEGRAQLVAMPTMLERKSQMAFSYSGLKTAVANAIRKPQEHVTHGDIAAAFQEQALGQLVRKLVEAIKLRPDAKSVLIAGGVAANSRFKALVAEAIALPCHFPPLIYCSDNGAMIAAMGYYEWQAGHRARTFDWDVFSRYPFETYLTSSQTSLTE